MRRAAFITRSIEATHGGVVSYQGQSLAGAQVTLDGAGQGPGSFATTDEHGRFELRTFEPGDGAVPGMHRVRIRKIEWSSPAGYKSPKSIDDPPLPHVEAEPQWLIPARYGEYETSGLTALVEEKQNEFQFELTSEKR